MLIQTLFHRLGLSASSTEPLHLFSDLESVTIKKSSGDGMESVNIPSSYKYALHASQGQSDTIVVRS